MKRGGKRNSLPYQIRNLASKKLVILQIQIPLKFIKPSTNPQNQEPGYVIYSAVGSFYAPMLVMMFFNWRIYQTAKKTTKAIRQGWTRVKGVSGEDSIGKALKYLLGSLQA